METLVTPPISWGWISEFQEPHSKGSSHTPDADRQCRHTAGTPVQGCILQYPSTSTQLLTWHSALTASLLQPKPTFQSRQEGAVTTETPCLASQYGLTNHTGQLLPWSRAAELQGFIL